MTMSRRVLPLLAIFVAASVSAQPDPPQDRNQAILDRARLLTGVDADGCLLYNPDREIVVCGTREIDREQRLPFPELTALAGERVREPLPKGNAEIVQQGRCYITMTERNCFKGLPLLTIGIGGRGPAPGGAVGRLWQLASPPDTNRDYEEEALIRALPASADEN